MGGTLLASAAVVAGRFEVVRAAARGGMGQVYEARDATTGARVALKLMLEGAETARERFAREVELLSGLRHPAVVRYVAHGFLDDRTPWLAVEWLEGEDLAQVLLSQRREQASARTVVDEGPASRAAASGFPIDGALAIGRRIAGALAELGERGIVHRDVKPGNIVLPGRDPNRATLIDLGAARVERAGVALTREGTALGTPAYMAPEQVEGAPDVGPAADVFALGVVLFELLAGTPPFMADQLMALLAKIMLADPPDLRELRPDAPERLIELVERCLQKRAPARPGAAEVAAALGSLEGASAAPTLARDRRGPPTVGRAERRARAVLVIGPGVPAAEGAQLVALVRRLRGELHELLDGTRLARFELASASLADQVALAARTALACRTAWPDVALAVASGRLESDTTIGPLLDRAGAVLARAVGGVITTDPETAALLETRFVLQPHEDGGFLLTAERGAPTAARTLLGRASSWVGRDRELTILDGVLDDSLDEGRAGGALIIAEPGMGKSRLRHEWLERARIRHPSLTVLVAHSDAGAAGAAFALLSDLVARAAGVRRDEPSSAARARLAERLAIVPLGTRPRTLAALAALLGVADVADEPWLASARHDPMVMGDLLRDAAETWLDGELAAAPVVVVVEDLHWGDLPSVRTLDTALRVLADRPLVLVGTARPEVRSAFPGLFAGRGVQEIELTRLGKRAAERLVRDALGEAATPAQVERLIAVGQGNPFFLEELVRRVAAGADETLPDSVLAVVEARLDTLGATARQVLRAASVLGETFEPAAVVHLLASDLTPEDVTGWLTTLVDREVLARPRDAGTQRLAFRHALVRDAAYAMLVDRDRRQAHGRAAEWLVQAGAEPLVLATHWAASDTQAEAIPWFRAAAQAALEGTDLEAVQRHVAAALSLGATGTLRGELQALAAAAAYWQSRYEAACEHASLARAELPLGSAAWFRALADEAVSAARLGDRARLDGAVEALRATAAEASQEALEARLVALCRATFQVVFAGRFEEADALLAFIAGLAQAPPTLGPQVQAQWHHVRGVRAAHAGDVARFFFHLTEAVAAFERAGDLRNVALESPTLGWCWVEVNDLEAAERVLRASIVRCERLGAEQATTYALVNLGYALAVARRSAEALAVLGEAIGRCERAQNPRLLGWALAHRAGLALDEGRLADARVDADRAVSALSSSPGLSAWARALRARVAVVEGDLPTAEADAQAAAEVLARLGGLLQHEAVVPLAALELHLARGERTAAQTLAASALARLEARAAAFDEPALRAGFLATPTHRTLAERCRALE